MGSCRRPAVCRQTDRRSNKQLSCVCYISAASGCALRVAPEWMCFRGEKGMLFVRQLEAADGYGNRGYLRAANIPRAFSLVVLFAVMSTAAPLVRAQKVPLAIDSSRPGAKIDRNLFGQFAEHLGHGIY